MAAPCSSPICKKYFFLGWGLTKRDLLQYYADVSPWLLPHLQNRAMVMKRYPNGINGRILFHEARAFAAAALDSSSAPSSTAPATSSIFP